MGRTSWTTTAKLLASLFFCYHALAVTAMSYPLPETVGPAPLVPFRDYINYTKQLQGWGMFAGVHGDVFHSIEPRIRYWIADGTEYLVGAVMPGFREGRGDLRVQVYFQQMFVRFYQQNREGYLRKVCHDLKTQRNHQAVKVQLEIKVKAINSIPAILRGEAPILIKNDVRSPFTCPVQR